MLPVLAKIRVSVGPKNKISTEAQPFRLGALEISKNTLSGLEVLRLRVTLKPLKLVHSEGELGPGPVRYSHAKGPTMDLYLFASFKAQTYPGVEDRSAV